MYLRVLLFLLFAPAVWAQPHYDNFAGRYRLPALPSAEFEANRMDRNELCDEQPTGRYVARGETLTITVEGLPEDFALDAMIGFRPMWGVDIDKQQEQLFEGENTVTATQAGPLFLRFLQPDGSSRQAEVSIDVAGGQPLPFYVDGQTSIALWRQQLNDYATAPFVQLFGAQAIITLPTRAHSKQPI